MTAISEHNSNLANSLSILFHKNGFSFMSYDENENPGKVTHFNVLNANRWEDEVIKELDINLRLRRNYNHVKVGFVTSFFSLVPNAYAKISADTLLNFSEAEFEVSQLLRSSTQYESTFVFGISQALKDKLSELYKKVEFTHSGKVFLDSISISKNPELHLNWFETQLEIVISKENSIVFYNLFDVQSDEDVLFFTLFAAEQLQLDLNQIDVKCYGQLLPVKSIYQTLKKYARFVMPALKNEEFLANYTLNNLSQCVSYPEILEEKK